MSLFATAGQISTDGERDAMKILVTGGVGYIGSHTAVELVNAGHQVVLVDNLSNARADVVDRIAQITGTKVPLHVFDVRDTDRLIGLFQHEPVDAVIHFAGLKAVGESVAQPVRYYRNNLESTLSLLEAMDSCQVSRIIFSSSATVYGTPEELPLHEDSRVGVGITNPYGWTKYMLEQVLSDAAVADPQLSAVALRYFNPIGAHPSGLIGEDPNGIPNNLLPYVSQVAAGVRPTLTVHGDDYHTPDGTGVRDYIHVVDLARGHLAALQHADPGFAVYNLGTGRGHSVLEVVRAFEAASGQVIPVTIGPRRAGDIATNYADATLAGEKLGWYAEKTLGDACQDTWRWQCSDAARRGRSDG